MRQAALLVLLVACRQGPGDDYPIQPPGPPIDPHPPVVDAATDGGATADSMVDAVAGITGRVCLIADPRAQSTCKPTGAGSLVVTVGTKTATTADDGTFAMGTPTGTNLVWHVTGTKLETSVMPFGSVNTIPAMLSADYLDLEGQNGAGVQGVTQGEVFARVVHTSAPLANAKAASAPQSDYGPLYDSSSATVWNSGSNQGTGAAGVAWFPGIDAGTATITIAPLSGTPLTVMNVPVEAQSITWIVVDVP